MPHPKVPCPNKGCPNVMEPDSRQCASCNLQERAAQKAASGLTASEQRRIREARERDRQTEVARRLAADEATTEDKLRDENTDLRAKLRAAQSTIDVYRKKTRLEDRLVESIVEFIEKNPYRPQLRAPKAVAKSGKAAAHEMLLNLSDAHYPEVVDPAATFGIAYNGDVCLRRLEYVRDTVIRYRDLRATAYPTQKLTVAVNGDMLSGTIHEELEVTNERPISESLVEMAYALFDMGCAFAESFPAVEFIVIPGNHPRYEKKPRSKQRWNNFEYILGKFLGALAGERFTVRVPKDLVYRHKIFSKTIGITHGDGVKIQSFAGIPFYSLARKRNALQALLKSLAVEQLDFLCYGHFHQLIFEEGVGCSVLINGSIKGFDEFIIRTAYGGQQPIQALLTFHPRHGMTDLSRINLGHVQ